jgi:hypothetical protein
MRIIISLVYHKLLLVHACIADTCLLQASMTDRILSSHADLALGSFADNISARSSPSQRTNIIIYVAGKSKLTS